MLGHNPVPALGDSGGLYESGLKVYIFPLRICALASQSHQCKESRRKVSCWKEFELTITQITFLTVVEKMFRPCNSPLQ